MAQDNTLWMAELMTRSFTFHAFGATQEKAMEALEKGWNEHFKRLGQPVTPFGEVEDDVICIEVKLDCAYLDHEPLFDPAAAR